MIAKETETIQYHREFLKLFKTKKEKEELMVENHILEQFERNKRDKEGDQYQPPEAHVIDPILAKSSGQLAIIS